MRKDDHWTTVDGFLSCNGIVHDHSMVYTTSVGFVEDLESQRDDVATTWPLLFLGDPFRLGS